MSLSEIIVKRYADARKLQCDRGLQRIAILTCRADVGFWVGEFGWTIDPREGASTTIPFVLYPKQAEFLRWLRERETAKENGVAEKSRDVGLTWLCCAYALHGWLFRDGFRCGFGSRKLELVDKIGEAKCIFEKIRFMLRMLPSWMLPEGFNWRKDDTFAALRNPVNGSSISGEGGDEIGRGDRASIYFVDESAFLERSELIAASLSQTTNCRIDVSTPNGPGNEFARLRHSGNVSVFTFHWKDDPRKNGYEVLLDEVPVDSGQGAPVEIPNGARVVYPWYESQRKKLDPVTIAQEIDIDYSASIEGVVIPGRWVRTAVDLALEASGPIIAGLDIAAEGANENVLITRQGPVVATIDNWSGVTTIDNARIAKEKAESKQVERLGFDADGVGISLRDQWLAMADQPAFTLVSIHGAASAGDRIWEGRKKSSDLFANYRAEMYWSLRRRFEKTFERVELGYNHLDEECISIPNNATLIAQLSMPRSKPRPDGKILIESKHDMRRRGVSSPDYADSLAYAFAPTLSAAKRKIVVL